MTAIATLLVVLTLSLLTVRVATVMLILTGLSLPLARFQARSAFTGCGYTTTESEQIVGHPVRRRIISTLMLLGNAGIVTTVGALMAGLLAGGGSEQVIEPFVNDAGERELRIIRQATGFPLWARLAFLGGGLASLWTVARSRWVERLINRYTIRLLRRYTSIEVRDYANLMHLSGEYAISELRVEPDDWLAEKPLKQLRLPSEGVIVLGINRADGTYLGAPRADTVARGGDVMIVYGNVDRLAELDQRRDDASGELRHVEAVADQKARAAEGKAADALTDEERALAEAERRDAEETREAVRKHAAEVVGDDG